MPKSLDNMEKSRLARVKLGTRLREARMDANQTLADVAKLVGASMSNVGAWETGNWFPQPDRLLALADYYDVSLDWLMGRSEEKRPADEAKLVKLFQSLPKPDRRLLLEVAQSFRGQSYHEPE